MGMMSVAPAIPGIPIPLDLDRDLTPVIALVGTPMALVARPDAPFNDLEGLAVFARSRNGAATFSSAGNGSINHLGGALLAGALGVQMTHVSYRGGAPAALDVSAGRIDNMVANVAEATPAIRAGQLKGIGVTAREASPLMPELPPLAGRLPALEINNWFGLAGPVGLPRDIGEGLAAAFAATLADPQTARTLVEWGLLLLSESGAVFEERIKRDREAWRRVVQANDIRGD